MELIKRMFYWFCKGPAPKCDCGDPGCKRELRGTSGGRLYVVNHFTCGKVKKIINDLKDLRIDG